MESHISEFSYGYALTSELMARFPSLKAVGAPEFETQNAEGKKGGGWDLKLPGVPVYLQFKRASRMVRGTAQEASKFNTLPFFRLHLHRRDHSDQHQLLLDLESEGNVVVYAAPGFSEADELNDAYSQDLVGARSVFVTPSAIGPLADDRPHWVAFQTAPLRLFRCSEPEPIDVVVGEVLFSEATARAAVRRRGRPRPQTYDEVSEELLATYIRGERTLAQSDHVANIRRVRERRNAAEFARLIARTLFQCEMLVMADA